MFRKMKQNKLLPTQEKFDTLIGATTEIYGRLVLLDSVRIDGKVVGNIETAKDTLFILEWPIGVRKEIYIPLQKRYVNYTANFDNFDGIDPYLHRVLINEIEPNFFSEGITYLEDLHSMLSIISFIKSLNANEIGRAHV